jgi:AraC-like DNA-binding protein
VTGDSHIRLYAGVPLKTRDGHVIGTVCASDRNPRLFTARDLAILEELAGPAMDRIELLQQPGSAPLDDIARISGFNTLATMRHHFRCRLSTSPAAYRARFRLDA